jgi:hypothetical protein
MPLGGHHIRLPPHSLARKFIERRGPETHVHLALVTVRVPPRSSWQASVLLSSASGEELAHLTVAELNDVAAPAAPAKPCSRSTSSAPFPPTPISCIRTTLRPSVTIPKSMWPSVADKGSAKKTSLTHPNTVYVIGMIPPQRYYGLHFGLHYNMPARPANFLLVIPATTSSILRPRSE